MKRFILSISILISISFQLFPENITIASFNTLRLGNNVKDYRTLSKIVSKFDLIGLEEVMNEKGLKKFSSAKSFQLFDLQTCKLHDF